MIDRYSRKIISDLWTEKNKFETYLKIEILCLEKWSQLKVVPKKELDLIKKKAKFDVEQIKNIEKETKHDVIAFIKSVSSNLGSEKRWFHYGLTSTDIVDTSNAYIYHQVNKILLDDIKKFINVLKEKALKYKKTPCIGRTHGVHAEITSFGLKWALWYDEMNRNLKRFVEAAKGIETGKISGAVGNYANNSPEIEEYVCKKLGINSANISTQVVQRDVHSYYFATLALIGSTIEKIATEIRGLQRTEARELEEFFDVNQKGSSAMPHKHNPISSENMCGCARVLRGYMIAAYENNALWHERDISHSSVERIIGPDATILLDYMLNRYANVLSTLTIFEENMKNNIYLTNGVIFSQRVLSLLIKKGVARMDAYDVVQSCAAKAYKEKIDFKELLLANKIIQQKKITKQELETCFTLDFYFKYVDKIFKKVKLIK